MILMITQGSAWAFLPRMTTCMITMNHGGSGVWRHSSEPRRQFLLSWFAHTHTQIIQHAAGNNCYSLKQGRGRRNAEDGGTIILNEMNKEGLIKEVISNYNCRK